VLSLARMVGAEPLCEAAVDLQGLASALTEAELDRQMETLRARAGDLRELLARAARTAPVSPSSAS